MGQGGLTLGRVGIDGDDARRAHGRVQRHRGHAHAAAADDGHMVVGGHLAQLLQGAVGGDAGAGKGGRALGRQAADGHQVARMRYPHQVGIAARQLDAQVAHGTHAQLLIAALADRAFAAAQPGVDHDLLAQRHTGGLRAHFDHLAADLVAHGHRQLGAIALQRRHLAAAHVEATFLDVQVGVAHAAMRDAHGDLGAAGRGQFVGRLFQGAAP